MAYHSSHRRKTHRLRKNCEGWRPYHLLVALFFLSAQIMPVAARASEPAGASGHVCQQPSACAPPSGASLSQDCDVRYRDLSLQYSGNSSCERAIRRCTENCDQIRSYEGSRSGEAIRHITTPLKSLITEYTPHLFYSLNMDELDEAKKEALRNVYRGTPGSSRDVFAMPGGGGAGASTGLKLASCVNQIETPSKPQTPAEKAMLGRLKIDNCTNQYILQSAVDPAYKENVRTYSMENANDPTQRINLASHCQPLTMRPSGDQTMNEYDAGLYLQGAWKKLLQDSSYRINPNAPEEPRLPSQIKINQPIAPPSPMPDVRVSMLMQLPYEEIVDPSHPFSPRWDFEDNDRDMFASQGANVFCAGDKDKKIIKVDILSFRDQRIGFTKHVQDRVSFNKNCMDNSGMQKNPCCRVIPNPPKPPQTWRCVPQPCSVCFAASEDSPACAVSYTGTPDRKTVVSPFLPVNPVLRPGGNLTLGMVTSFPYYSIAACTPLEPAQNPSNMARMCEQLRAPLIPINKLKMRYHDPEKLTESELPSGVPEGLTFKEYFGSNMPYIRLHDTGRPIQKSTSSRQDPMDDLGQYTAIVGVGREGVSGNAERKDERCLFGGWGGEASFGGVSISAPDPITSWTELKLYQTRTMRKDGLYCIGRYDKVFKPEGTEEKLLGLAGGEFNAMRPLPGATEQTRMSKVSWPLAWRGYITEPDEKHRFPNFGGTASGILTGLDNARLGDILILDENGSAEGSKPGLPRLAVVVNGSNNDPQTCQSEGSCWVNIQAADDGGSPDICGGTDAMGQVLTRTFYKPSASTDLNEGPFGILGISTDCDDQNLQRCVLQRWDEIKVYRIREDRRTPQNAQSASGG